MGGCCVSRETDVEPAITAPYPKPMPRKPVPPLGLPDIEVKNQVMTPNPSQRSLLLDADTEVPPSPAPSQASSGWSGVHEIFSSPLITYRALGNQTGAGSAAAGGHDGFFSPLLTSRSHGDQHAEAWWPGVQGSVVADMLQKLFPNASTTEATGTDAAPGCAEEGADKQGRASQRRGQGTGLQYVNEEDEDEQVELERRATAWARDRGLTIDGGVEDLYRYF
mmetsp:Transcript_45499/g.83286  ORF Transcript_45499/g.83286 Transcript_45499/m.83286 type:complete len:222 (-) Transcript_45499:126-791(-)